MKNDLLLFVGQKVIIDKNGEVLTLNDPTQGDDFPGGKIQEGETDPNESLKREIKEETGLEIEVGDPFMTRYFEFPFIKGHRNSGKKIFVVIYRCKYLSGEVKISNEHISYRWVNKNNYLKIVKRPWVLNPLKKYFSL